MKQQRFSHGLGEKSYDMQYKKTITKIKKKTINLTLVLGKIKLGQKYQCSCRITHLYFSLLPNQTSRNRVKQ